MVTQKRGYVLIDGLRGIAALAVASLHWQALSAPWLFAASGGLAVDLFFLLSGIVIAHAYDGRIASGDLNTGRFMLTRLIRFWPLYAIGTFLGAAAVCMALATGRLSYYHSYGEVGISAALTLLFIPQHWGGALFELNTPFWSLLWELLANLAFVVFWRRLSINVLSVIVALGAIGLVAIVLEYGQLSGGNLWDTAITGPVRVVFSFFLGVVIQRVVPRAPARSQAAAIGCAAALVALFAMRPGPLIGAYHLLCVLLVFPAIGVLAMRVDAEGLTGRIFSRLGDASYGVYVLHIPTLILVSWIVSRSGLDAKGYGPAIFLVSCSALVGCVLFLDRHFDRPARAWLMHRFGLRSNRGAVEPRPI